MFSSLKERIALGAYVLIIISIPVGSYLVSQRTQTKSRASEGPSVQTPITGQNSASQSARDAIRSLILSSPSPSSKTTSSPSASPTSAVTFGPTMNFKLRLEGRPLTKQASKVFIGISEGLTTGKQSSYVLSFTVDLPDSGEYDGLSLAGLNAGSQYTAFIKPTAQLATSSAFVVSPSITALNSNQPITLLTGDLNEDNVINVADYNILLAGYGTKKDGVNWNPVADFNLDNTINNYDRAYILKNMSQVGDSGPWISSPSASLKTDENTGGPENPIPQQAPDGKEGYWIWVPKSN